MAFRCFYKELVRNPVFYSNGSPVPFEHRGDDGLIRLDDATQSVQINDLLEFVRRRRGGVILISEARYEELKKNPPSRVRPSSPRNAPLRLAEDPKLVKPSGPPPVSPPPRNPAYAPVAKAPENVVPVAGSSLAQTVKDLASGEAFKPRVGRPKKRDSGGFAGSADRADAPIASVDGAAKATLTVKALV